MTMPWSREYYFIIWLCVKVKRKWSSSCFCPLPASLARQHLLVAAPGTSWEDFYDRPFSISNRYTLTKAADILVKCVCGSHIIKVCKYVPLCLKVKSSEKCSGELCLMVTMRGKEEVRQWGAEFHKLPHLVTLTHESALSYSS